MRGADSAARQVDTDPIHSRPKEESLRWWVDLRPTRGRDSVGYFAAMMRFSPQSYAQLNVPTTTPAH